MIKNPSWVNQYHHLRGWSSRARTSNRRTRRGRVGCARIRRGDRRRGRRRTWTHSFFLSVRASGCSLLYRPFGNNNEFIRPRIGLTAMVDLIRVFFGQMTAVRKRYSGGLITFAWNWAGGWSIQGSSSVSEIPKSLQMCTSVCVCIRPWQSWWYSMLRGR